GAITQESFGVAPAPGGMMYLSAWDFTHKSTIAKISPLTGVGICTESPLQLSPASYQPPIVTPQVTQFNSTIIANALNYATFMEPGEATMICTFVGNEEANLPFEMEVSPNPFNDRLHIDWGISSESEGILRLIDLQGRVLATKEVQQGIQALDWQLPELGSGMLLLQYESDGVARTVKLVSTGN
ncbi:MAG: T9SS type A sorting domain-containing protein, partial [Bacteroidia bacterium]|nr:T9SS type A sorting domain-containing protein [Bacteroidia bacterium]